MRISNSYRTCDSGRRLLAASRTRTSYFSLSMRIALNILGILCLLIGCVWFLQGINIIPGSFMTGDRTWFYIGLVLAFVGVVLLLIALRRRNTSR